jgi:hypothetical protein
MPYRPTPKANAIAKRAAGQAQARLIVNLLCATIGLVAWWTLISL